MIFRAHVVQWTLIAMGLILAADGQMDKAGFCFIASLLVLGLAPDSKK